MKKFFIITILLAYTIALCDPRSNQWSKVRKEFLKTHTVCAICGTAKSLQVHHIKPFHLYPHLELEPTNLIVLCTSRYAGFNCHFDVGHVGNFKWENTYLLEDVKILHDLILKYKGYTVLPEEISDYLWYIKETKKQEMKQLKSK